MHGEALPGSRLAGTSQLRPWLGPAADIAIGVDVLPRLSLRASAELDPNGKVRVQDQAARDLSRSSRQIQDQGLANRKPACMVLLGCR